MEQVIVYHRDGSNFKLFSKEQGSFVTKLEQRVQLLGVDTLDLSVTSCVKLDFEIGDKINILGNEYKLNLPAKFIKDSENRFVYEMQLEGVAYDLLRANYSVNVDTTSNDIQDLSGDSLTGDLKMFLDVLISNANRVYSGTWSLGSYPSNTETRTETFGENDNCLSVLQSLCSQDKYNTEFKINVDSSGNKTLNVGSFGSTFGYKFQYGKGKGLFKLERDKVSTSNIITRLWAFGSTKNIVTSKYRASKLCLPTKSKSQSFIENSTAISAFGIWEYTKNFDNVFPERVGTVSSIDSNILKFSDSSIDFDLNAVDGSGNSLYLIAGTSAKIDFTTGNLAGYSFELSIYDHATKSFIIKSFTDENGFVFPNAESSAFQISVGDKYVISDIYLPQSYIDSAESRLNTLASDYLDTYSKPRVQYSLDIDKIFLRNFVGEGTNSNIFWVGDYIEVKDTDYNIDTAFRIVAFTRDLLDIFPNYKITLSDFSIEINNISRLISEVNGIQKIVKFNNLKDPAKARRSWLSSQEVLGLVFDTEGQYYSEKIKPLSIETTMLSVGAKSQQLGLTDTEFYPNYGGNKNRIVYKGGVLSHLTFLDSSNNPRNWTISDGDVTLSSDVAYYIYAKCSRTGDTGTILFSTSEIVVDSDGSFYHFLLGVINSVDDLNVRSIYLTYGNVVINGRSIRAGRIISGAGEDRYYDIDTGEMRGDFKFSDGTPVEKVQTVINGGLITTGTIEVGQGTYGTGNAGITGEGSTDESIRMWAGSNFAGRNTAPFRVQDDGKVFATDAEIAGKIDATSGTIGGFQIANERIGVESDSNGLSILSELLKYSDTNIWSGLGKNVFSAVLGFIGLAKHEIDYSGVSGKSGVALKIKALFSNALGDETIKTRRALWSEGNIYSTGGHAFFDDKYIGQAYSDTIQNRISITHKYIFTYISDEIYIVNLAGSANMPTDLPTSVYSFELSITVKRLISNTIRLTSVIGGQIIDNDGNSISFIDLAQSDTLILRYFDGCYYIVSLQRNAL